MSWAHGSDGAIASGAAPLVVAYPSGISSGDILLLSAGNSNAGFGAAWAVSDGAFSQIILSDGNASIALWWKVASGSETGNFNVTGAGGYAQCSRFTGGPSAATMANVHNSAVESYNTGASFTVVYWNAMTVTVPNTLIIGAACAYSGTTMGSGLDQPSPWTGTIGTANSTFDVWGWEYYIQTTATNLAQNFWSPTNTQNLNSEAVVVALVPAAASTPVPRRRKSRIVVPIAIHRGG